MTACTDDERREVATRLRNNASQDMDWMIPWAVFNDAEQHASEAVVRRLADLIDPGESGQNRDKNRDTVQIESPGVQIEHECDRDALLALADEMDEVTCDNRGELSISLGDVHGIARRIREACGEVVG